MNRRRIAGEVSTLGARHCRHTGVEWALNGRGRPFPARERPKWAGGSSTEAYDFQLKKKNVALMTSHSTSIEKCQFESPF